MLPSSNILIFFRCRRWVINTRREDLVNRSPDYCSKNLKLCANHFEDSQFTSILLRNRLTKDAIPTIFDVPNPPQKFSIKRKKPCYGDCSKKTKTEGIKTAKNTNISDVCSSDNSKPDVDKTPNNRINVPKELKTSKTSTNCTVSKSNTANTIHDPDGLSHMEMSENISPLDDPIETGVDEPEPDPEATSTKEDDKEHFDCDDALNNTGQQNLTFFLRIK